MNRLTTTPASLIKIVVYAALLLGLYHSAFAYMVEMWDRPQYNYCYFMPFVVLYLVWDKRSRLSALLSHTSWKGLPLVILGLMLFWLGELGGEYFTLYISFWLVLVGLCWTHLGWQKLKTIAFALFMVLTMFPLPDFIYNKISFKLQLLSSQLGTALMRLYGMSVHREGNIIDLAFTKLQVVEACSGLRSLMSLAVLGLLMAYFLRDRLWKRGLLVLTVIPLSVLANSIRLAVTGILHKSYGSEIAEGFFHGFSGWVIFCFAFIVLAGEAWALTKIGPRNDSNRLASQKHDSSETNTEQSVPNRTWTPAQPQFVTTVFLLVMTIAISEGVNFREKIPIKNALETFPLNLGKWQGKRQTMAQGFVNTLDLSDYTIVIYENPSNQTVNLYVAYYESQRKRESIHSPATCLPGSGWMFNDAGTTSVSTPGYFDGSIKVNRAFMTKMGRRKLTYYWFPQRGRILTNAYQLKLFTFWDALTTQRTDGALVRLITPVSEKEAVKTADARLQEFVRLVVPVLQEYIPN